jgi:DNA-binding response OmpR family regulator
MNAMLTPSCPLLNARATRRSRRTPTVCIVDPAPHSYEPWRREAEVREVDVVLVASAAEALRIARTQPVDFWLVSAALAGLSGVEVCDMLRRRQRHATIALVAEEYSPDLERSARRAGVSVFVCKPTQWVGLAGWVDWSVPHSTRKSGGGRLPAATH